MEEPVNYEVIVDNRKRSVEQVLCDYSGELVEFDIVSAYFSISGYMALKKLLDSCSSVRFLYGDPSKLKTDGLTGLVPLSFVIDDRGLEPREALVQSTNAKLCYDWVSKVSVSIHQLTQHSFLHGKYYHLRKLDELEGSITLIGSSNFTARGLKHTTLNGNYETNHRVFDPAEQELWHTWYDEWWGRSRCVKDDVKKQLERVFTPYSARKIYYKTLLEIFQDRISPDLDEATAEKLESTKLVETSLWKALYEFQKDAAIHIIQRLRTENGLILADSTGLGKTYTALAVISWFYHNEGEVLLLCPKRLENNWLPYTRSHAEGGNPFGEHERGIPYSVAAHTDLLRESGFTTSGIDLGDWNPERFKLIVVDESHYFRNQDTLSYEKLSEIISTGPDTKVLLLSATPVNTSLRNLSAQLLLMNRMDEEAYLDSLDISNVSGELKKADREINEYIKAGHSWGDELSAVIGEDSVRLITHTTIARSRTHIEQHYQEDLKRIGGKFPVRVKPKALHPIIDTQKKTDFSRVCEDLLRDWSVYQPEQFLVNVDESESTGMLGNIAYLMRSNMVKRLESSCYALYCTLNRLIQKAETRLKWCNGEQVEILTDDENDEDEEFIGPSSSLTGEEWKYQREEIDCLGYAEALQDDIDQLNQISEKLSVILESKRDGKLKELVDELKKRKKSGKKTVVFTAFADTANYLFDHLQSLNLSEELPNIALITGSTQKATTGQSLNRAWILNRFAPHGQGTLGHLDLGTDEERIDILISTDCMSEGQNLQDADAVIHYDVHWNPVRLVQRFGRIDRLQSTHEKVYQTIFWPTEDIDEYLNLKRRVESRKRLVSEAGGTELDVDDQSELERLREEDLKKLKNQALNLDDLSESKSLSNLSMHDFVEDLIAWLKEHKKELENIPFGTVAAVSGSGSSIEPEVVFCLKGKLKEHAEDEGNHAHPIYRVVALKLGENGYAAQHHCESMREALTLMRTMQEGPDVIDHKAQDRLAGQLLNEKERTLYSSMLSNALEWSKHSIDDMDERTLRKWELVSWMIRGPRTAPVKSPNVVQDESNSWLT